MYNDPFNSSDPTGMADYDCTGGLGTGNCSQDAVLQSGDTIRGADGNTYSFTSTDNGNYAVSAANQQLSEPRIAQSAQASGDDVVIDYSNATQDIRSGGTRAWRNNNPGNIEGGPFATGRGSLGTAARFAVFPDEATGAQALDSLLQTPTYQALSVQAAIARYAPSNENNTANYQQFVQQLTGIAANTPLNTLTPAQKSAVASAIRRMEGWRPGNVDRTILKR